MLNDHNHWSCPSIDKRIKLISHITTPTNNSSPSFSIAIAWEFTYCIIKALLTIKAWKIPSALRQTIEFHRLFQHKLTRSKQHWTTICFIGQASQQLLYFHVKWSGIINTLYVIHVELVFVVDFSKELHIWVLKENYRTKWSLLCCMDSGCATLWLPQWHKFYSLCLRHRPGIELGHLHCLGLVQLRQVQIQLGELWRRGGLLAHSSYYWKGHWQCSFLG